MQLKKHIKYFASDPRGEYAFIYSSAITSMVQFLSGLIMKIILFLKNIKQGRGNTYIGIVHFQRFQNSTIQIGNNCVFLSKPHSNLLGLNHQCILSTNTPNANLLIGNNCGFSGTSIGAFTLIHLGDNVRCGANTIITDSDWHADDPRSGEPANIIIEDNVWLGVNVIVLKGVTIGKNSVIGAGSIVTRNIPENVIAAGNPCKVIKPIQ